MYGTLSALGLVVLVGAAGLVPSVTPSDNGPVAAWLDAALPEATDLAASPPARR